MKINCNICGSDKKVHFRCSMEYLCDNCVHKKIDKIDKLTLYRTVNSNTQSDKKGVRKYGK